MSTRHPLFETWDWMCEEQIPNFLRLYLNPAVAQTCLCLARYIQDTWYAHASPAPEYQTFLANGFDEALSGAIKLARFSADAEGRPKAGLAWDLDGRLGPLPSHRSDALTKLKSTPARMELARNNRAPAKPRRVPGV